MAAAFDLILTGRQIDAHEALTLGLVQRVVPAADLRAEARRLAENLLANGPLALRAAKQAIGQGFDLPLAQGLDFELSLFASVLRSDDAAEGPRAFAAKHPPRYQAR